jgi:invasion protein IalB
MHKLFFAIAATLIIGSAPASAQTLPAQQQQQSAKPVKDPNEVVCERQEETGSRLASHQVCMTRAQWAEQRRLNRQDIEKIQVQRPCTDRC